MISTSMNYQFCNKQCYHHSDAVMEKKVELEWWQLFSEVTTQICNFFSFYWNVLLCYRKAEIPKE